MKKFEVVTNLESEPRIKGCKPQYYYILFILQIVYMLVFVVYFFSVVVSFSLSGFTSFFIVNVLIVGLILLLRKYFKHLSGGTKYQFKKQRQVLSNKDLTSQI